MPYELPDVLVAAGLAVEAAAALASLALAPFAASEALRVRRWPGWSAAVCLLAGAAFTILYAGSADDYFTPPRSRWDGGGIGGRPVTVAALCLAGVATLLLVLGCRRDGHARVRVGSLVTAAAASGLLTVAWTTLTIGH